MIPAVVVRGHPHRPASALMGGMTVVRPASIATPSTAPCVEITCEDRKTYRASKISSSDQHKVFAYHYRNLCAFHLSWVQELHLLGHRHHRRGRCLDPLPWEDQKQQERVETAEESCCNRKNKRKICYPNPIKRTSKAQDKTDGNEMSPPPAWSQRFW